MAKILVADDSRTSRKMLLDIIRSLEFDEILEATDGNDAVAKFEAECAEKAEKAAAREAEKAAKAAAREAKAKAKAE